MTKLRGRVVVVTGAAGGIGSATCRELVDLGCRVGMLGRGPDKLAARADQLRRKGGVVEARPCDVRDRLAVAAAVDEIERGLGPIDVLIHCAGVARITDATAPNLDELEEMCQVNYLGGVYALAAVLPGMVRRGHGHVVGISSLGARRGLAWSAGYAASKAALTTYLESLRPPLRRRGILVTTVFPGFVRTAMTDALPLGLPVPLVEPRRAARHLIRAIRQGRREASFPWDQALGAAVLRVLPAWAFDFVMTTVGRLAIKGDY